MRYAQPMKNRLKDKLSSQQIDLLKKVYHWTVEIGWTALHQCSVTQVNRYRHRNRPSRRLEIGPGTSRIEGFEGFGYYAWRNSDYVGDAARKLPFADNTFELIYASHILEHIPWYGTEAAA